MMKGTKELMTAANMMIHAQGRTMLPTQIQIQMMKGTKELMTAANMVIHAQGRKQPHLAKTATQWNSSKLHSI